MPHVNSGIVEQRPPHAADPGVGVVTVPGAGSVGRQRDITDDTSNTSETRIGDRGTAPAVMGPESTRRGLLQWTRGCLVWTAVFLAVVGVIGVGAFQLRAPVLGWVGELLYHADPLTPADAILAFGDGTFERNIEAADLFAEGYGPTVVLTRPPERAVLAALRARGLRAPPDIEIRLGDLAALGVPRTDVTVLQRTVGGVHS